MTYFAIGTTLANMVNLETVVSVPPTILDDGPAPLVGSVVTRLASGATRRDGFVRHVWRLDLAFRAEFNALMTTLTGAHFTAQSRALYISTIDETGHYSPFACYVERPYPQEHYSLTFGGYIRSLSVPFNALRLQSVTKTANYTVTTSDRLIYADTSGGHITLALPAAASVTPNTVYSFEKTAAANVLTLDGDGSELINGSATLALTALRSRADLISNGTAWTSVSA